MSDRFPRRSAIDRLLRIASVPFGLAAFGAAPSPHPRSVPQRPKVAQLRVAYVEIAVGRAKRCSACEHFVPSRTPNAKGSCARVDGAIAPTGHCEIWAPREHD